MNSHFLHYCLPFCPWFCLLFEVYRPSWLHIDNLLETPGPPTNALSRSYRFQPWRKVGKAMKTCQMLHCHHLRPFLFRNFQQGLNVHLELNWTTAFLFLYRILPVLWAMRRQVIAKFVWCTGRKWGKREERSALIRCDLILKVLTLPFIKISI